MEALDLYRKEVEANGEPRGQYNVGRMYELGLGVEKSDEEAVKWFRMAADQGDADAQHKMGFKYLYGNGVEWSDDEAVKWFRKAAEQGDWVAQLELGYMYGYGVGVERDPHEASKWYGLAAEEGDDDAVANLGCLAYMEGSEQSYEEARRLFEKASDMGSSISKVYLASMYIDGLAGEASKEKALELLMDVSDDEDEDVQRVLELARSGDWNGCSLEIKKLIFSPVEYVPPESPPSDERCQKSRNPNAKRHKANRDGFSWRSCQAVRKGRSEPRRTAGRPGSCAIPAASG